MANKQFWGIYLDKNTKFSGALLSPSFKSLHTMLFVTYCQHYGCSYVKIFSPLQNL